MTAFAIAVAGLGIGVVFGVFGAGGSAFAAPVLALLGVPGALAVASPLPGMIPAALTGARRYLRAGAIDVRTARLAILGGIPGTVVGGLASVALGGQRLLVLSGLMLLVVGARVALPDARGAPGRAAARRGSTGLVVGAAFVVGVMTGVLANGGGFLLVPLFIIVLGLGATASAGASPYAFASDWCRARGPGPSSRNDCPNGRCGACSAPRSWSSRPASWSTSASEIRSAARPRTPEAPGSTLRDRELPRIGRVVCGATDAAAELGAFGSEDAPAALEARNDPVVQHPDVRQRDLPPTTGHAFRDARLLAADDESALEAQAAVDVVLVPPVIGPGEPFGRATRVEQQIAEADDVGAR